MTNTNKLGLSILELHHFDRFLFSWVLATFIGVIAGWKVFDQINLTRLEGSAGSAVLISKWFISLGIAVSLTQWIALQQAIKAKWWLSTSIIGYIVGGTIAGFVRTGLTDLSVPVVTNLIAGAILGTIAGAIQWLGLRYSFSHASLWIFFNGIGWSLGWASFRADFFRSLYLVPGMQAILPAMLLGIPLSIFTGVAINWLLQNKQDAKQHYSRP